MFNRNKKGFTLIELLTVIAIIGILAVLTLVSLDSAKKKARDAKRLADFSTIQTALMLYYDKYGVYPCGPAQWAWDFRTFDLTLVSDFLNGCAVRGTCEWCVGDPTTGLETDGLLNGNLKDPLPESYWYAYEVSSDRQQYDLYGYLEANSDLPKKDGGCCSNLYEVGNALGSFCPSGAANLYCVP